MHNPFALLPIFPISLVVYSFTVNMNETWRISHITKKRNLSNTFLEMRKTKVYEINYFFPLSALLIFSIN